MRFKNVIIGGIASALPDDVWSSSRIEEGIQPLYNRLGLQSGRLELMTGIEERRHWSADFLPSDASILAGQKLISCGVDTEKIDVLIHASVCRNRLEPATAAYVHNGLGLSHKTQIFDLSNACLGVLNAMVVGASMIESGVAKSVIIVSGENGRTLLDWTIQKLNNDTALTRKTIKPFFANLTIGSGAVAIYLCHQNMAKQPSPIFLGGILRTDSSACRLCEGGNNENGELSMETDAEALLDAGIALSVDAWNDFKTEMAWNEFTPSKIITHQVGKKHQARLFEALNLDTTRDISTFNKLGNTGSVALPITLCHASENKMIANGEQVLLLGIGSGLSTLMLGIQWQK